MTRTQVYLPSSKYEELKQMAASRNQTFAAYLRELIDEGLKVVKSKKVKKHKNVIDVWLKSLKHAKLGKEEGVIRYGSTRLDDYLYGEKGIA